MSEIKGCPLCGANPHQGLTKVYHDQLHGDAHQDFKIHCPHGCAQVTRPDRERATEAWNTRAPDREQIRYALIESGYEFNPQRLFVDLDAAVETIAMGWEKQ